MEEVVSGTRDRKKGTGDRGGTGGNGRGVELRVHLEAPLEVGYFLVIVEKKTAVKEVKRDGTPMGHQLRELGGKAGASWER
jgi:hypothetical protein